MATRAPLSLIRAVAAAPTDADTIRAAGAGESWAVELLWMRHHDRVRGLLTRMLGSSAEIDDAVQEVFSRLFRKLPELRDVTAMQSFAIGIAIRFAKQELRRRRVKRWLRLTDTGSLPDSFLALPDPDARDALERLYRVLERVGAESRALFVLRHVEQLELTEMAAALGESLATVKRKLYRATLRVHEACGRDPALLGYLSKRSSP